MDYVDRPHGVVPAVGATPRDPIDEVAGVAAECLLLDGYGDVYKGRLE